MTDIDTSDIISRLEAAETTEETETSAVVDKLESSTEEVEEPSNKESHEESEEPADEEPSEPDGEVAEPSFDELRELSEKDPASLLKKLEELGVKVPNPKAFATLRIKKREAEAAAAKLESLKPTPEQELAVKAWSTVTELSNKDDRWGIINALWGESPEEFVAKANGAKSNPALNEVRRLEAQLRQKEEQQTQQLSAQQYEYHVGVARQGTLADMSRSRDAAIARAAKDPAILEEVTQLRIKHAQEYHGRPNAVLPAETAARQVLDRYKRYTSIFEEPGGKKSPRSVSRGQAGSGKTTPKTLDELQAEIASRLSAR